jgi:WD40 repeat protein
LGGDLVIPAGVDLRFTDSTIIDGQGHVLTMNNRAQLLVDTKTTLTLRNLIFKNKLNTIARPAAKCLDWYGKLALDNVEMALVDDFYFYKGELFIHNDVVFTGSSQFVYWGVQPCFINSTLCFDKGTAFDYRPSTTDKALIKMQSETSSIYFDGCTLKATHTGMQLTKGRVYFDNKITITSAAESTLRSLGTQIIKSYGTGIYSVAWSPDRQYLAIGGWGATGGNELQIYSFDGSSLSSNPIDSKDYGTELFSISWSPDGRFLAIGGFAPVSGNELQIYSFNGSTLSSNPIDSKDYGGGGSTEIISLSWSPDGKYLVIGGQEPAGGNELQIYSFNGSTLSSSPIDSKDYGSLFNSAAWSPDGRFLAIGGGVPTTGNELQIYSFNGSTLSLNPIDSKDYGTQIYSVAWSPDGRFLAIGGQNPTSGNELQIYSFNGSALSLNPIDSKDYGTQIYSIAWSPDGRYLAVGGNAPTSNNELQIYLFDGSFLSSNPIDSKDYGTGVWSVEWSPDGRFLAIGGESPDGGHDEFEIYPLNFGYEAPHQAATNSIVFSDVQNGVEPDASIFVLAGARIVLDGIIHL